jgi:PAS domain S-box-containing protein
MRSRLIAPIALILGLTVAGFITARVVTEHAARRDGENRAKFAATQVFSRVTQAVALTESLSSLMDDARGTGVTQAQFHRDAFLLMSSAGFLSPNAGAAWVERVPASQRAAYERQIGRPIVSPNAQDSAAGSRSSYLPATLVSGFSPTPVAGIDLSGEPGIAAALDRATRDNYVAATPGGRVAGTGGIIFVAPAPNLIAHVLHRGYVVLFVPNTALRAAAQTRGAKLAVSAAVTAGTLTPVATTRGVVLVVGTAATANPPGGNTLRQAFQSAGQLFAVDVPQQSVQGTAAALPWIILAVGVVLAGLAGALGLYAGRRARAQAEADRIFNLSTDLIAVADFDGHFTRVNPAFERTLGYSSEELCTRPYAEFVHPDDRARTKRATDELSDGREVVEFENRYLRADGSLRWLEWSARSVPGEAVIYAAARDVTERKQLEEEQAALRRVAELVARGAATQEVFDQVTVEASRLLEDNVTLLLRYEPSGAEAELLARSSESMAPPGTLIPVIGDIGIARVWRTGRAARIDDHDGVAGVEVILGKTGASVLAPIVVEGRLWGVLVTGSPVEPLPADTEERLAPFCELVGVAIADAEYRAQLKASRARIVASADEARRRLARDVHDGAQQRLVHALITLKQAQATLDGSDSAVVKLVDESLAQAEVANVQLRELANGILPAALVRGGLRTGIESLLHDTPIPVDAEVLGERLPEAVETTVYFVIAEALTNVMKHAGATRARVRALAAGDRLEVEVSDNGRGGADPANGSGLMGLIDRVDAAGGSMSVSSPAGAGTRLTVTLPIDQSKMQERP